MKLIRFAAPAAALVALTAGRAAAQGPTQEVTMQVDAINQLAFFGTPSLVISTATAGSAPTSVTANATYSITTNESSRKITAQLNADTPTGVTLSATLAAPSGASSTGAVALEHNEAHDVVRGIAKVSASGLNVTYTLSATAAAGVVLPTQRIVTYTIVDQP
ncbi:MAG TPA: hypothetical protein VF541_20975 [Longimicrobium sp.]|jgi:hypothetical protein